MKNMDKDQKAKIIAFAKLLGVEMEDKEIIAKFEEYYNNAIKSLSDTQTPKCEVFNKPF